MKFLIISLIFGQLAFLLVCSSTHNDIAKLKTSAKQFYVFSSRKGCVSVESAEPCPVTWTLSPYFAKRYKETNKDTITSLKFLDLVRANIDCKNNYKAILCSQRTPRCYEDGSKDYGQPKEVCEKMYVSCPRKFVNALKKQKFCEAILTDKQPISKCVFPSKEIPGACPQPKYKMPLNVLKEYIKISRRLKTLFEQLEKSPVFLDECLTQLKEVLCNTYYCSKDEQRLLMKYVQEDCVEVDQFCFSNTVGSFPAAKQLKSMLNTSCQVYPKRSSAQREAITSTASSSYHVLNSMLFYYFLCFLLKI